MNYLLYFLVILLFALSSHADDKKVIKVFILAGQSTMEGHGVVSLDGTNYNNGKGNLEWCLNKSASAEKMQHLIDKEGNWAIRDDVYISYKHNRKLKRGKLSIGYTPDEKLSHFGPELQIGHLLGDHFDETVLLIKTAWAGKSLITDFRPPSSSGRTGPYYIKMIDEVKSALRNINTKPYAISGFIWQQGWNDMVNEQATNDYSENLVNLIQDIRKEFKSPEMPAIIGELGNAENVDFRRAQMKAVEKLDNTIFVKTAYMMPDPELSPNPGHIHHWCGNAESFFLLGDALGKALLQSINSQKYAPERYVTKSVMNGYLGAPKVDIPLKYNAGFSLYVSAWPIQKNYPGPNFQSGLFGTWMGAYYKDKPEFDLYSTIEGGLGWWRDTRFATETPKFIMGGVAMNFAYWANGPGAGSGPETNKVRDWKTAGGKYGVAQLSPYLLWPPDGLNLKQGTFGELFGYGYLPLPLTNKRTKTEGKDVPTGNQCWTLFLNTKNFKGPVAFFQPYHFSKPSVNDDRVTGILLDSNPSSPRQSSALENQYMPAIVAQSEKGDLYARVAPVYFPKNADKSSVLVNNFTSYERGALWDRVDAWFNGGDEASGQIDTTYSRRQEFKGGWSSFKIKENLKQKNNDAESMEWMQFYKPCTKDKYSFVTQWDNNHVKVAEETSAKGYLLPEYYYLDKSIKNSKWKPIRKDMLPEELRLDAYIFARHKRGAIKPYLTPQERKSSWKTPGPAAGPYTVKLCDGSQLTYFWYRFADQPSMLNADLSLEHREIVQSRVEKIHRKWKKDQKYLAPPSVDIPLAEIDNALIVTPPKGLEIGYVPIVTKQEAVEN